MSLQPFLFDLDDQAVLEFTVLRRDNTVYDLTGTVVTMIVEAVGEFSCTITDAPNGECTRTVDVGDFPRPGRFRAQLKVAGAGSTFRTDIFIVQVSESLDSTTTGVLPPSLFPSVGGILFGSAGGAVGQDLANLFWDAANTNLKLFGGTVGTSGSKVVAVGVGAPPSTSPAGTVQWWAANSSGASTGSFFLRDEVGAIYYIGGFAADTGKYAVQTSSGRAMSFGHGGAGNAAWLGTDTADPLLLQTNGVRRVRIDTSGNVGFNTDSFGASAAKVIAIALGTAPTTAPADLFQVWTDDRNGAGTSSPFIRTEDAGINERLLGVVPQAFDNTERTTTSTSTVDLSTLTVNIPPGDGFVITGLVRKTAGAAATVSIGIKVNGSQIMPNTAFSSAVNQIELGCFQWGAGNSSFGLSRDTNYTQGGTLNGVTGASGGAQASYFATTYTNQLPTAAITSITITGLTGSASVTLAVKNITVYRVART